MSAALWSPADLLSHLYVMFSCDFVTFSYSVLGQVWYLSVLIPGPEVLKLEYSLKLKIRRNDWLLADTCPHAANHCALF